MVVEAIACLSAGIRNFAHFGVCGCPSDRVEARPPENAAQIRKFALENAGILTKENSRCSGPSTHFVWKATWAERKAYGRRDCETLAWLSSVGSCRVFRKLSEVHIRSPTQHFENTTVHRYRLDCIRRARRKTESAKITETKGLTRERDGAKNESRGSDARSVCPAVW